MFQKKKNKTGNITLIGMSGVGKTTFGRELANRLKLTFVDVDILIKNDFSMPWPEILKQVGPEKFKEIEEKHILSLSHITNSVISPGGSVIYSNESMNVLSKISQVCYLHINPETLAERVGNKDRGIVGLKDKSFADLYRERMPLYEKYADFIVDINHKNLNRILEEITDKM